MKGRCSITFPFVRRCKKMFQDASLCPHPNVFLFQAPNNIYFVHLFLQITRQKVQIPLCNRKAAMTEYLLKNHNRTAHSRPFFRKCVSETMNACLF